MIIQNKDFTKIKRLLRAAYFKKDALTVDGSWQKKVMASIQDLSPHYSFGFIEALQRMSWRLVPVACALIILLGIAVSQTNSISDYELISMMSEDPADYSLLALNNN